ncbi:MAG: hypothetical protein ACKOCN_05900 [Planctomycetaceae bacterium]
MVDHEPGSRSMWRSGIMTAAFAILFAMQTVSRGQGTAPAPAPPVQAPDLAEELADIDAGGLGESVSDTPGFIGDGQCPTSIGTSQVSVGRLVVISTDLVGPNAAGFLEGPGPSTINTITDSAFNSVQSIQAAGYPSFILPAVTIGQVPGSQPAILAVGGSSPGAGITPVLSPDSYTAAVDDQFANNPALNTGQYAGQDPQTIYDPSTSGAIRGSSLIQPTQDAFLFYNYVVNVDTAALLPGLNVGFVKMVENSSPIPRDRVYFNYSYFHHANSSAERADVNRFVPGFEKTFFDNWTSIEVRTPFAGTLSNMQAVEGGACGGVTEYRDVEFGNMSVIFKSFLVRQDEWGVSAGTQVFLPTAQSTFIRGTNQNDQPLNLVFVENQSVHLLPFVGAVWAPTERFFSQSMLQMDVDTNGSPVYVNPDLQTGISEKELASAGRVFYPTYMYLSFSAGYWLFQRNGSGLTGFSPMMEIHVNQAMDAFQPVEAFGYTLGNDRGIVSVTNGLVGCNLEWNTNSTLTFAYVTPLGGGFDRFFDGELRAFVNWRFGRQTRIVRAQF